MTLSKNAVYQGDCVRLLKQLDQQSVDLAFADPPFNIGYEYDVYNDARHASEYLKWCDQWIVGIHRALKPDGTFWLAIGDEYAAELKILSQKAGFHCRSWVIWYYTFGVNCVNGFSRSHTHLFHFVKDKSQFTFNRFNPQIRVQSARQLVYADNRANPNGRLPDNTWITRPQDAPLSFSPNHDTWYFARVAGTFKEREGFHGCQMPEQLLARIIRCSSHPQDLVVDPFGGSGTTLAVAKKLGRQWIGFELSAEYVKSINQRLSATEPGNVIDGPEDALASAPTTVNGKQRKKPFNTDFEQVIVQSFQQVSQGLPADYLLCDESLKSQFIATCRKQGISGNAAVWNHYLLRLRKAGKLPRSTQTPAKLSAKRLDQCGYAAEVAWALLSIDYHKTLDDILCVPELTAEFDRLAALYGPVDQKIPSLDYRRAALSIRKRANAARTNAQADFAKWISKSKKLRTVRLDHGLTKLNRAGAFLLTSKGAAFYAGEAENMRTCIEQILGNQSWLKLETDAVSYVEHTGSPISRYALKSALAQREFPVLNCRLLMLDTELA